MPEPSRDAFVFAGFLLSLAAIASYLRLPEAVAIVTFALSAAAFLIGYRFGLPVVPPELVAAKK